MNYQRDIDGQREENTRHVGAGLFLLRPLAMLVTALVAQIAIVLTSLPIAIVVSALNLPQGVFLALAMIPTILCIWLILHGRVGERAINRVQKWLTGTSSDIGAVNALDSLRVFQDKVLRSDGIASKKWDDLYGVLHPLQHLAREVQKLLDRMEASTEQLEYWVSGTSERQPLVATVKGIIDQLRDDLALSDQWVAEIITRNNQGVSVAKRLLDQSWYVRAPAIDPRWLYAGYEDLSAKIELSLITVVENFFARRQLRKLAVLATLARSRHLLIVARHHDVEARTMQLQSAGVIQCEDGEVNLSWSEGKSAQTVPSHLTEEEVSQLSRL